MALSSSRRCSHEPPTDRVGHLDSGRPHPPDAAPTEQGLSVLLGDAWGKVDPGESLVDALAREWMEELRLDILRENEPKPELLRTVEYRRSAMVDRREWDGDVVPVTFYRVYAGEQTPQMNAAIGLAWATAPLLSAMALTPGTYKMREFITGLLEIDERRLRDVVSERPPAPDPAR